MLKQPKIITKHSSGFTMIELAMALAIAGTLMYFAIPAYSDFSKRQALSNETNDLLSDLGYARSLAIENGSIVTVTSVSGNATWSGGWNISETLSTGALNVVRTKAASPNNISITATSTTAGVTAESVSYNSIGSLSDVTTFNFNFQIKPDFPNFLSVSILPSGLATSNRDAYGSL